ncbi:hypothetical protein [uncultured Pseudacidovorax sp.]|uniref:hypothetical protein n=1 Tax=uncultured Pseudacidovorax sp. TaxID=679313 RepID=UPI0025EAC92C|nr:hypothetical protein [uncultured Pseudacidovorax sp.]
MPRQKTGRADDMTLNKIMKLRDEFAVLASNGRFNDAASREWSGLPLEWRVVLLILAGLGDVKPSPSLMALAGRSWAEMPPPEREAVRAVVRVRVPSVARLRALAARV